MPSITNNELDIICQFITNYPPPFYESVQSFAQDLYSTGCRPEELLDVSRWITSILDPAFFTLTPLKGNFTREILKGALSDNFILAWTNNVMPYESLSLRQLNYSMKQIYPVGRMFSITKIIVSYPFRYNAVRRLLSQGFTQAQISVIFGWVAPTIIASYSTQPIESTGGGIPAETFYLMNVNIDKVVDSTGDNIIST